MDAETRTTLRGLVDARRRQRLRERGYQTPRESLASSCYDTAAGDPLLALWYAIVWTMIERGSLPGSRPLRFKRARLRDPSMMDVQSSRRTVPPLAGSLFDLPNSSRARTGRKRSAAR